MAKKDQTQKKGFFGKLKDSFSGESGGEEKEIPKPVVKNFSGGKEVKRAPGEALANLRARIKAKQEKARSAKIKSTFQ